MLYEVITGKIRTIEQAVAAEPAEPTPGGHTRRKVVTQPAVAQSVATNPLDRGAFRPGARVAAGPAAAAGCRPGRRASTG